MIMRRRKIRGIRQMLKSLSIVLLEGSFDDICNTRSGVFMEQDDLALSIGSFLQNSLIHIVQLGYIEITVDRLFPLCISQSTRFSKLYHKQIMAFLK